MLACFAWPWAFRAECAHRDLGIVVVIATKQIQTDLRTAGGFLVTVPATILFLFAQRRLVGGLTGGARAIAFQNAANSCRIKPSSQPGRLNLLRRDPFDPSF